ncbi:hypothetical protein F8O06_03590 [Pseudoclavibacter sp. CFCC 14310]|uniref:general stress protein n=1 Tax=Pseudoclavibacter sp. CFCC 14310 TaxID=2615180 RepID=UPI0013011497|nr:general stress protein [Pseudoclavibacter sp. CFCC 14310]KAB1647627.1 hypothetical protein F8O06_03590 [Pseudoclavibacter sp. CFCC 14310]
MGNGLNSAGQTNPHMFPTLPTGTTVAEYKTYREAVAAVDQLVEKEFPVEKVSVVGNDLHSIERITTGLSYPKAALSGLVSGLWFGLFLGLIMLIWTPNNGMNYLFAALALGAGFGIISGIVTYALTRRYKNYQSTTAVVASAYAVVTDPSVAGQAQRILGTMPSLGDPTPPRAPQI